MSTTKNDNTATIQVGPGGAACLTILFVLLKVFGYISWSWWWVFAPLWIGLALFLVVLLEFLLFAGVVAGIAFLLDRK